MNVLLNRGGLGLSTRYLADSECLTPMNYTYQTYQGSKIRWVYHFRKSHWRNLLDTHLEAAWFFSHAKTLLSIIILLILTAVVYCCRGSRSFVGVAGETVTFANSEMVVEMFPIRVPWRLFFFLNHATDPRYLVIFRLNQRFCAAPTKRLTLVIDRKMNVTMSHSFLKMKTPVSCLLTKTFAGNSQPQCLKSPASNPSYKENAVNITMALKHRHLSKVGSIEKHKTYRNLPDLPCFIALLKPEHL